MLAFLFLNLVLAITLDDVRTPALLCYRSTLEANAARMRVRAEELGCALRPHMKTCKTVEAGVIATGGTRRRVTVSTIAEARFFADAGFDDILYAVPLTADKVADVEKLHAGLAQFHVMIDHAEQAAALIARLSRPEVREQMLARPLSVFVGVDCGYHRDGCDPNDPSSVALVRMLVESGVTMLAGIYTHGGHSYDAANAAEIVRIAEQERDVTAGFRAKLRSIGLNVPVAGVGSTPTCSLPPAQLDGIDEMHPGNFLYYDMTQVEKNVSKFRRTTPFWNMPTTCRRATQAKKQKTAKAQSNTILKRPHAADYRLIPARDGGVVSLHLSCTIASTASPLPSAGPRARRRRRGLRGHLAQARLIVSLSRAPKDATFD